MPAAGFSIGFERIVDLVDTAGSDGQDSVALVYDPDVRAATLISLRADLIAGGARVRLEKRPRNRGPLFDQLRASGFRRQAPVSADVERIDQLEFRPLD